MPNRVHLMSLAAFAALAAISQAARADDYSIPDTQRFARSEELAQPMTCAQATAFAWFKHQMELSDGAYESVVAPPAECEVTRIAESEHVFGDREVIEESK